jgi:glutaredoxin-like YruB-family protein
MKNVIVYTSNSCTYCVAAKDYLRDKGVEFEERNVSQPQFRKELMGLGYMSVPVLKIDEDVVVGFDQAKIDELINS